MAREIPAQVVDYFQRCVPDPPSAPRGTILTQSGQIRMAPERSWMPFSAHQTLLADRVAFVWRARFKMARFVSGVVEDSYQEGQGRLDAKLWGFVPVAHARGAKVDRGEAQRYLAELVWCPMALLHNRGLRFRVISERSVRVWTIDEETYVDWQFDGSGDIVGVKTGSRFRGEVAQPWEGRFTEHRMFEGIRAPSKAEVRWVTPDGPFVYWRGHVDSLRWVT